MRSRTHELKPFLIPVAILLLTGAIAYLPGYAPILYSDDWPLFGSSYIFDQMKLVDWSDRRPLVYAGFKLLLNLFGLNLNILYPANALVITLCALVVFFLMRRLFTRYQFLALPIAILFLIYPVDRTRMWLIQNYTWIICLETLLALYLMLDFAQTRRKWEFALALLFIILPLGAYEAQLGLAMAGSVLLAVLTPKIPLKRRALLLAPIGIGILFAFWRAFYQPMVLKIHDPYMDFQLTPGFILELLKRLGKIFPTFIYCWVEPFTFLLGISLRRLLLLLIGLVVGSGLLAFWASKENEVDHPSDHLEARAPEAQGNNLPPSRKPRFKSFWEDKKPGVYSLLRCFGLGVVLLLAGYVPAVISFTPTFLNEPSRMNLFAILGGAMALGSLLGLAAFLVAPTQYQMRVVVMAALIPLALTGITQQIWNQNEARLNWAEQKDFWHATFRAIPNLQDRTTVIVVMPDDPDKRPFKRIPNGNEWEVTAGFQVLYNNPTLHSIPYTHDKPYRFGFTSLEPGGVRDIKGKLIPYEQVVFIAYVPRSNEVQVIHDPEKFFKLPFLTAGYQPERRVLSTPPASAAYRSLVK